MPRFGLTVPSDYKLPLCFVAWGLNMACQLRLSAGGLGLLAPSAGEPDQNCIFTARRSRYRTGHFPSSLKNSSARVAARSYKCMSETTSQPTMLVSRTLLAVITCQFESAEYELVVLPVISQRRQDLGLIGPPDRKTPSKPRVAASHDMGWGYMAWKSLQP